MVILVVPVDAASVLWNFVVDDEAGDDEAVGVDDDNDELLLFDEEANATNPTKC